MIDQPERDDGGGVQRITWRTADIVRILLFVALFLLLWHFFWMVVNAVFLGLLAVLVAIILHAPARFLSRWMPFRVSFPITLLAFAALMAGLAISIVPQIVDQVGKLAAQLPAAFAAFTEWLEESPFTQWEGFTDLQDRIGEQLTEFLGRFVPFAFNLIAMVAGGFAVMILAVFLAAQPHVYREMALQFVPPASRDRAARIFDEGGRNLRNWVIGKVCVMIAVGIFTYVGLLLFGVPGALALAALAALLEFIPNFGPILAWGPAVIAAFLVSPATALYVTIFYIILQQIQSAVTVPLVERKAVNIPPAALLIWQIMLVIAFGFLGLFVATPLLALLAVAVRILYLEPAERQALQDRRQPAVPAGD